jgi:hypothetical protein
VLLLRERSRAARPSSRVDRSRLPATAALDGWPSARASGCTEPGLQASSPAACTLTCGLVVVKAPVPFWFGQYEPQNLVDGGPAEVLGVGEQVPVGVHRLGECRVAQPGLNDLRIEVRGDQRARIDEAVELALPPGVPVVQVIRTVFDSADLPVEVQDSVMAADRHQFRYEEQMR